MTNTTHIMDVRLASAVGVVRRPENVRQVTIFQLLGEGKGKREIAELVPCSFIDIDRLSEDICRIARVDGGDSATRFTLTQRACALWKQSTTNGHLVNGETSAVSPPENPLTPASSQAQALAEKMAGLSQTQLELARHIAAGRDIGEIAQLRGAKSATVTQARKKLFARLGVYRKEGEPMEMSSRVSLIREALQVFDQQKE